MKVLLDCERGFLDAALSVAKKYERLGGPRLPIEKRMQSLEDPLGRTWRVWTTDNLVKGTLICVRGPEGE